MKQTITHSTFTSIAKMALLLRSVERSLILNCHLRNGMSTTVKAAKGMEEFWKKNRRLNRPLSPHLSIYKPQMTSMLSITHRATGIVLTGAAYLGPILYLFGSGDYYSYLTLVKSWGVLGTSMIWTVKTGLAFSFSYHLVNGIRHLAWDWAMGFKLKQLYASGYTVMASSVLLTAALLIFI